MKRSSDTSYTQPLDRPSMHDNEHPGIDPVSCRHDIEGSVTITLLGVLVVAGILALAGWVMTLPADALSGFLLH